MNRRTFIGTLSAVATYFGFKQANAASSIANEEIVPFANEEKSTVKYGPYNLSKYKGHDDLTVYFRNEKGDLVGSVHSMMYDHTKYNPGAMYFGYVQQVYSDPEYEHICGPVLERLEIVSMSMNLNYVAEKIQKVRNEHLGHD